MPIRLTPYREIFSSIPLPIYTDLKDGLIKIPHSYIANNFVSVSVPPLASFLFHEKYAHQVQRALHIAFQYEEEKHITLINPADFGGSYNPRHIGNSPKRPLSFHALALALDLNVHNQIKTSPYLGTFNYAKNSYQHPALTAIFIACGFYPGLYFRHKPDGMHFQINKYTSTQRLPKDYAEVDKIINE